MEPPRSNAHYHRDEKPPGGIWANNCEKSIISICIF